MLCCLIPVSAPASTMAARLSLLLLPLFFLLHLPPTLSITSSDLEHRTFIVRVNHDSKPSVFPTHRHWYESTLQSLSPGSPNSPNRVIHSYDAVFHGFSAQLSNSEARQLQSQPHVLGLLPEQVRSLHTTRSPEFLGLKSADGAGLLKESDFGSDLVIGVIDTGIWPERESFNDRELGLPPVKWKGKCVAGKQFPATVCNRKIIGARYFCEGYEATNGPMNETVEIRSPRDTDGHGTHTASIAAGRYVSPAALLGGYAAGVAAGMAPKARLAVYKVCWDSGCYDSDILAAFDAAVIDGVDIISLSVGGVVVPYYLDSIAIGAFGAIENGVFVSASAGNGGPGGLTVTNIAPWMTTVGAGTLDRDFPADVVLGNGKRLPGVSLYGGPRLPAGKMIPLTYAGGERSGAGDGYSASLCMEGSLDPKLVEGKIVVCDRGINSRAEKGEVVRKAGGVGMILANGVFDGEGLVADCHILPATSVGSDNGDVIRKYIAEAEKRGSAPATATIEFLGTRLNVKPAPLVASFSARGPNPQTPEVLKPDLIAPGLNILAAWPDGVGPSGIPEDRRRVEFNILSGTSMACPHVSGIAALLKAAHPEWSPAAIKSALMTTAYTHDSLARTMQDESTGNSSTPMDFGSGHVDPQKAMDPGLVYDLSVHDYVDFLCNLNYTANNVKLVTRKGADCRDAKRAGHAGNLNYPALSVVFQQYGERRMSSHFIRTVTNVGDVNSVYVASVMPPSGTKVTVEPSRLAFRRVGQRLSFLVRVEVSEVRLAAGASNMRSGAVVWSDGKHTVTSPLVVTLQQPL